LFNRLDRAKSYKIFQDACVGRIIDVDIGCWALPQFNTKNLFTSKHKYEHIFYSHSGWMCDCEMFKSLASMAEENTDCVHISYLKETISTRTLEDILQKSTATVITPITQLDGMTIHGRILAIKGHKIVNTGKSSCPKMIHLYVTKVMDGSHCVIFLMFL